MGKIGATQRLFSGRLNKSWAREIVRAHPRMADYIQQAPVIISLIEHKHFPQLRDLCERGVKLREVMAALGLNPALRNVHPHAVILLHRALFEFDWTNVSALAQQLRKRDAKQQREFFSHVIRFKDKLGTLAHEHRWFEWMAENLPVEEHDTAHYADYFARWETDEVEFSSAWKWRDFKAALKKWEDSFTEVVGQRVFWNEAVQRVQYTDVLSSEMYAPAEGVNVMHEYQQQLIREIERRCFMGLDTAVPGADRGTAMIWHGSRQAGKSLTVEAMRKLMEDRAKPLTPHKAAVLEDSSGPYTFRMLNTENELTDEGAAMRHCVGGYGSKVRGGHSLIYSISRDGKRIATMELASAGYDNTKQDRVPEHRGWRFEQIKGVRNAPVAAAVETIARAFAAKHFKITQASGDLKTSQYMVRVMERYAVRPMHPQGIFNYNATS